MGDKAEYKVTSLRFSGVYNKTERDNDFVPKNPSAEAQICLNCTEKKCKPGTCKRYREEYKKLKEKL